MSYSFKIIYKNNTCAHELEQISNGRLSGYSLQQLIFLPAILVFAAVRGDGVVAANEDEKLACMVGSPP